MRTALWLTGSLLLPAVLAAAGPPVPAAATPEEFARAFVGALAARSPAAQAALAHPRSRACMNAQTQGYFDWIYQRRAQHKAPASHTVAMRRLEPPPAAAPDGAGYPVQPTHVVPIDFARGPHDSVSILVMVAPDGGRWVEVLPCPTPEAIAGAAASNAARDAQEGAARALVSGLEARLRQEVTALLSAGRKIDAIRRVQAATGAELVVARRAVEILRDE